MADERERWEQFAKEDPEYYVYTPRLGSKETAEPFFAHGERLVEEIIDRARPFLHGWGTAVEIGCGVGRLAVPMSRHFTRVVAVDIAPTMLLRLGENCQRLGITNVEPMQASKCWEAEPADFLYSVQVFQHIEDFGIIEAYFPRIARCLGDIGVGYLHFDARPQTPGYRMRRVLPDPLLPRPWRRGIRRTRRAPDMLLTRLQGYGLDVVAQYRFGTDYHVFLVRSYKA